MQTISLKQVDDGLAALILNLSPGEEIILTSDEKTVATIRAIPQKLEVKPRQFGSLKGTILNIAPDFDDIPEGFEEYLL